MQPIILDNNYKLIEKISEGDTGDIYLSIDQKNKRLVVIKRISIEYLTDLDLKNLKRKLGCLYKLKNCSNINTFIDFLKTQNNYYIILEYCNGGDLYTYNKNYIKENKHPLNELYIQKIIQQIVSGIEYMCSMNIIHNDIKLENILINFDGYPNIPKNGELPPKLSFKDMSFNKHFTIKIAGINYETSTKLGNNNDKEKKDKAYNTSIDLSPLGIITYELLTGTKPIIDKNSEQIYQNIKKAINTLPKELKCSIEIISFINGLLQFHPEKRLNWQQIKSHPFLIKDVNSLKYIELEMINIENEKQLIDINSKGCDNLLWILFKCKNIKLNIDKINQMEIHKPEIENMINNSIIINKEIKKALEEEELEKKKEKQKIEEIKAKAKEEIQKAEKKIIDKKKEQEKLIIEENNIKNMKNELINQSQNDEINSDEKKCNLEIIELKLEKNKSSKESIDDELKNNEEKISENENILKFAENQINLINLNETKKAKDDEIKSQISKLSQEKIEMENENKLLKEELKKLKENNGKKDNDNKKEKNINILEQQINECSKKIEETEKKIENSLGIFSSFINISSEEDYDDWVNIDKSIDSNDDIDDIDFEDYTNEENIFVEDYIEKKINNI